MEGKGEVRPEPLKTLNSLKRIFKAIKVRNLLFKNFGFLCFFLKNEYCDSQEAEFYTLYYIRCFFGSFSVATSVQKSEVTTRLFVPFCSNKIEQLLFWSE